ncbi:MAG: aldehyde dehydrogenase [Clostridiales bacterium]|nr:aldehyde dehydrogenase [Clostridiales bacterium]
MTIHDLVALQREAFEKAHPYDVEDRLAGLERLREAIERRENEICAALEADLGKCAGEAYMTEIGMVLTEISCAVKNLKKWARPKRVKTHLVQFPARSYIIKEAYGVVLIMAPWNYPFQLTISPFVGALAAGNHCILKPSDYSPATSQVIASLIAECFPVEQAAVVLGGRKENQALLDERFDYIFFTGGVTVGKLVLEKAARHVTPVTLELGGKSPCIVDETACIPVAARRIAFGKALNSGQTCVAPDYLMVHEKVKDRLLQGIWDCWEEFYGDALQSAQWPRMVNEKHYQRVMGLIRGENIYCGGAGDGIRIAPTILTDVSWEAPVMQEEIFGPVLPVITFRHIDEVIPMINSREKPLALYLFSRNAANQEKILDKISFGGGCVNDTIIHLATDQMPFGGVGQSGMGGYHGKKSFDTFTHEKSIVQKANWLDIPVRYAPFTQKKLELVKKLMK